MKTRLAILLILSGSAIAACSSAGAVSTPGATPPSSGGSAPGAPATSGGGKTTSSGAAQQVSDANGVKVAATWGGAAAGAVFDLAIDTHSGSLDSVDLTGAVLRNDRGQQLSGASWSAPAGGHHRSGQLSFTGNAAPVFRGASWVELVLPNVGGVPERVLRWEVGA